MAQTANFNLEKPDITRDVDEELYQLQETLDLLDTILKTLQDAVNSKAASTHTHTISQVIGLAAELAAKMPANQTFKLDDLTDVDGADGAPNGYVLVKTALGWIPSSALAALGPHGHLISEITGLVDALAGKADAGATATALAGKVSRSGDTLTGQLTLPASTASLSGLRIPDGVDPTAPADGDIWRRDAGGGLFLRKGGATTLLLDAANANQILHVRDQKAQGTDAGTSISGGQVRALNTVVSNSIPGASLASNRVTLPAGTYDLFARAPAFRSNRTKAWLRNVATTTILTGSSEYSANTDVITVSSFVTGRFTLATTTDLEIAQSFEVGVASNGLGASSNVSGQPEVFTEAIFRKVS